MARLYTPVSFIDLTTDQLIETRLMPVHRLETAARSWARWLATQNRHPVVAFDEAGLSFVMPPRGTKVNRPKQQLLVAAR